MTESPAEDERFEFWKRQLQAATTAEERARVVQELVVEYLPYIRMLARPQLAPDQRSRFDSEDIRQTIGWRVADRLLDGRIQLLTEPQFRQLLKTMIRNLLRDRSVKRPEISLDASHGTSDSRLGDQLAPARDPTASAQIGGAEWRQMLWAAIERQLQPDELYLFREHHLEGVGYAELAERLGLTPDAVRMRLNRARERLRHTLKPFGETFDD